VSGLERFGTPDQFVDIVKDMYNNISTYFQAGSQNTRTIPITRGVKQDDPLSPLLFNIAMDPLLETLEQKKKGYKYGPNVEDTITSFCYADDNAITSGSIADMNDNLHTVQDFCNITGMRFNIRKSACLNIIPARKNTYKVNANKEKIYW
jgi:hypothetical protein